MLNESNLHDYQLVAKQHVIDNSFAGLIMLMGLGKTVSTLTAFEFLKYADLSINTTLVVAPKRVARDVWVDEVNAWSHLKHLKVEFIGGTAKQRQEALRRPADVYTISRDNIAWLVSLYDGHLPFDMLIVDESSSFKNHASKRFKALKLAQPWFKRVVILTGTPASNGLIDLWAQIWLLDRGERLGKTITSYRQEFFKPGQSRGHVVYNYSIKQGAEDLIYQKIDDLCISMRTEDYLKLPGSKLIEVPIKFDTGLQAKYNEFERESILELINKQDEEVEVSALNAAALSNKLLQFANGAVYDEERNVHEVHDLKLEECKQIVESAQGQPVLIAYTYQHDRDRLLKALKEYKPRLFDTTQDKDDWNTGKVKVMLMHPASGGHGLNLQKGGNIIVWFGQTWSLELWQQFNARLDRQGQESLVMIYMLIAHQTIDQRVLTARKAKEVGQDALINYIKVRIKKYMEG